MDIIYHSDINIFTKKDLKSWVLMLILNKADLFYDLLKPWMCLWKEEPNSNIDIFNVLKALIINDFVVNVLLSI